MRIVHICLACFYVDGMGYQENMLPKYHAQSHEVYIVTSDFAFDSSGKTVIKDNKEYLNEYGIPVKVLDKSGRYGPYSRFRDYAKVYETLSDINPDIIFCHGGQFVALKDVIRYCKRNRKVKLFIDQHGDYYNTPVDTVKRRTAQYWIFGHWMRKAVRYTEVFWGVTPWRCQYLKDVYGIPENKIALLPMGGDDEKIHFSQSELIRESIRKENDILPDDFLLITGGKIDRAKNIDILMRTVAEIDRDNLKLLVFGQPHDDIREEIELLAGNCHIRYVGWIPADHVYDYFLAADLAVFPGTHSVLWEQACASKVPCVFKKWPGMDHVDVGGNCCFLENVTKDTIRRKIESLLYTPEYWKMKETAESEATDVFLYSRIAEKSLECAIEYESKESTK